MNRTSLLNRTRSPGTSILSRKDKEALNRMQDRDTAIEIPSEETLSDEEDNTE